MSADGKQVSADMPSILRAPSERSRAYTRINRLLRIVGSLDSLDSERAKQLHKTLGISRRTLYRDLALLKDAGLPIVYSRRREQFISQDAHSRLDRLFTVKEKAAAIAWIQCKKKPSRNSSFESHLKGFLEKLINHLQSDRTDREVIESCVSDFLKQTG